MDRVSRLITQKLETMINAGDPGPIHSKHKAITALFPYAAWQKKNGQHQVFDVCLHAARASKQWNFIWHHIEQLPVAMLLKEESPVPIKQAFVLMSPHLSWLWHMDEHWVQQWAAAASAVPYTDEIGQSVVDTLLQIASNYSLQSHIPVCMWSWLRKSPSLPPICAGRFWGTNLYILRMVQELGDIETLTSYLLLVWSEWEYQDSPQKIHALIREDFSGLRMGYHRKRLLQHLDNVLGQLELGLEHLQQHDSSISEGRIQERGGQYRQFKEALLEVDREATELLICEFFKLITLPGPPNTCGQLKDPTQCLCVQSLSHVCSYMTGGFPTTSPAL